MVVQTGPGQKHKTLSEKELKKKVLGFPSSNPSTSKKTKSRPGVSQWPPHSKYMNARGPGMVWCTSIIPALGRLRQEDQKLKFRLAWIIQ
jgi:hypothetical protein